VMATVAHLGLEFIDLYIRRGDAIIRGRQDQSYLRIGSLPLGVRLPLSARPHPMASGAIYLG
jgi:hypothetical protein